jgi:hypothetical protein
MDNAVDLKATHSFDLRKAIIALAAVATFGAAVVVGMNQGAKPIVTDFNVIPPASSFG